MFMLLFIFRFLQVLLYSKHITEVIMHITLLCIIVGSGTRVGIAHIWAKWRQMLHFRGCCHIPRNFVGRFKKRREVRKYLLFVFVNVLAECCVWKFLIRIIKGNWFKGFGHRLCKQTQRISSGEFSGRIEQSTWEFNQAIIDMCRGQRRNRDQRIASGQFSRTTLLNV